MSPDREKGVRIVSVEPDSEAFSLELQEGDRVLSVDREAVGDALDVRFLLSMSAKADLVVLQSSGTTRLVHSADSEELLSEIELEPLDVWRCTSDCIYCFCKQNPPGARRSLFFRDEDFRMSFLAGSYTTMAAVTDAELDRIARQRLSPQYLTVPSTNEQVRRFVLGVRRARPIREVIERLGEAGIELHVQIVVVPEINDGPELDATIGDLNAVEDKVSSVAIVPVGTTRFTRHPAVRRQTQNELRQLLSQVQRWQRIRATKQRSRWIEAADEVYLALGLRVPAAHTYGTFPQLTTGVGMVRRFLDDVSRLRTRRKPSWWGRRRALAVTGQLFEPSLRVMAASLNQQWGEGLEVLAVMNDYFGSSVTVSGLLGGRDVETAVQVDRPEAVFLPENMLDEARVKFVDDTLFDDLQHRLKPVHLVTGEYLSDCVAQLTERLA